MQPFVYLDNLPIQYSNCPDVSSLKREITQKYGIPIPDLYVSINGKLVSDETNIENNQNVVRICTKIIGGKGGFGSMLRAIGAQIEKTTNREACRDLSGRRLRDINEEKRLRKWLEGQEEREREIAERKQKKIERLIAEPKINVDLSPVYEKERQELPERVSSAVEAGWEAAGTSESGLKRKIIEEKSKAKKKKLWIDADLSECSSDSDESNDDEVKIPKQAFSVSTDSGNESDKASSSSKSC